jgi:fructokinase
MPISRVYLMAGPQRFMILKVGIDVGGTKIAGVAIDANGDIVAQSRQPTPREDYDATIRCIREMVAELSGAAPCSVGIGIPGSVSRKTGKVHNANSTWINARPLQQDLETALGKPVRLANDANCLALSEAADGAGAGALGFRRHTRHRLRRWLCDQWRAECRSPCHWR